MCDRKRSQLNFISELADTGIRIDIAWPFKTVQDKREFLFYRAYRLHQKLLISARLVICFPHFTLFINVIEVRDNRCKDTPSPAPTLWQPTCCLQSSGNTSHLMRNIIRHGYYQTWTILRQLWPTRDKKYIPMDNCQMELSHTPSTKGGLLERIKQKMRASV